MSPGTSAGHGRIHPAFLVELHSVFTLNALFHRERAFFVQQSKTAFLWPGREPAGLNKGTGWDSRTVTAAVCVMSDARQRKLVIGGIPLRRQSSLAQEGFVPSPSASQKTYKKACRRAQFLRPVSQRAEKRLREFN